MKDFNFFNNVHVNDDKQLEYNRWVKLSVIFLLTAIILIACLQANQLSKIYKLKKEKVFFEQKLINFDNIIIEKNKIKTQKQELQNKLIKFQKRSSNLSKNFVYEFLTEIAHSIPEDLYLQTLEYNSKSDLILKGHASVAQAVTIFVQNLNKIQFVENVKLEHLKFKENQSVEQQSEDSNSFLHEFFITLKLIK